MAPKCTQSGVAYKKVGKRQGHALEHVKSLTMLVIMTSDDKHHQGMTSITKELSFSCPMGHTNSLKMLVIRTSDKVIYFNFIMLYSLSFHIHKHNPNNHRISYF